MTQQVAPHNIKYKKLITGLVIILAAVALAIAGFKIYKASTQPKFTVSGNITQARDKVLYFEAMTLNGVVVTASARLDNTGAFEFTDTCHANPEFYRLRIEDQVINVSIDSTESITIQAELPIMATGYEVKGSVWCDSIRSLSIMQVNLQRDIKQVLDNKQLTAGEQQATINNMVEAYKDKVKREYILSNPAAPFAYFALFQAVGGQLIFNPVSNPDDVRYVGAVATAWDELWPETPRAINLHNIAIQGLKNTKRRAPVSLNNLDSSKIKQAGFIDISLPERDGATLNLSDIKNKVILLDFTMYSAAQTKGHIMHLRDLYNKYQARGFEIYQVSLDADHHYWLTASEHLPWHCVFDKEGAGSTTSTLYRVAQLPCYFLIDKQGNLVARREQIKDLKQSIEQLLAQ